MKKITLTILMMVILGSVSFGQYTASLQTITASPGENVAVNLTVNNFNSIGSFQFFIKIDVAVLTFQNISNFMAGFIIIVCLIYIKILIFLYYHLGLKASPTH